MGTGHGSGTAAAFDMLRQNVCAEVAKPEWWNDEGLKALSVRVVRAALNKMGTNQMRAVVLGAQFDSWERGVRSTAEFTEAATRFDRAAALCDAPAMKASNTMKAVLCRRRALRAGAV